MLIFINGWVAFTLVLFYLGPIDWDSRADATVGLYVLLCLLCFNGAALLGRSEPRVPGKFVLPTPRSKPAVYTLISIFFVLSMVQIYIVTGKNPLSPSSYSLNFGETYEEFDLSQSQLHLNAFGLAVFLTRAAIFPSILLILFDRINRDKISISLIVIPMIISSLLRGTDKELFDIFIILFVAAVYRGLFTKRLFYLVPLAPVMMSLFVLRRISRFHGKLPNCLPDSTACFSYTSWVSKTLGPQMEILYVFFTSYVTQGYQGLAYAMRMKFHFNYFFGHLPPLKQATCAFTSAICDLPDYQSALTLVGWDTSNRWITAYTVIANDLSFWFVPLYMILLGIAYRRARMFWKTSRDIPALCTLFLIAMFFIYSSANMQIAISLEWTAATLVFIYAGLFRSSHALQT